MKRLTFKSACFGLLFAVCAALLSAHALAGDPIKPVERISWVSFDSGDGNPGDTSGDGGIRNPGPGH